MYKSEIKPLVHTYGLVEATFASIVCGEVPPPALTLFERHLL